MGQGRMAPTVSLRHRPGIVVIVAQHVEHPDRLKCRAATQALLDFRRKLARPALEDLGNAMGRQGRTDAVLPEPTEDRPLGQPTGFQLAPHRHARRTNDQLVGSGRRHRTGLLGLAVLEAENVLPSPN